MIPVNVADHQNIMLRIEVAWPDPTLQSEP